MFTTAQLKQYRSGMDKRGLEKTLMYLKYEYDSDNLFCDK